MLSNDLFITSARDHHRHSKMYIAKARERKRDTYSRIGGVFERMGYEYLKERNEKKHQLFQIPNVYAEKNRLQQQ